MYYYLWGNYEFHCLKKKKILSIDWYIVCNTLTNLNQKTFFCHQLNKKILIVSKYNYKHM